MRISFKHKLIAVSIPKCGSHSMFKLMEDNFDGINYGSFHGVVVPDYAVDYTAFTFVRNPYSRAVSIYNTIADPGDGSDIMRLINHEFYKREVEDLEFETFCGWLGNCPEESIIYEFSTSQYDHLAESNITDIYTIKIDEKPLERLNDFLSDNNLHMIYELPHELDRSFEESYFKDNEECIKLINSWAGQDFKTYNYKKIL